MDTPSPPEQLPRVAVMGAGAVGSYFGGMLARAGADVTLVARPGHVEAIRRDGLFLDGAAFQERVRLTASAEPAGVKDAEVVLFCVKTIDTEVAAKAIAPHLAKTAIVLSLQNGVDNVGRIELATGIRAVPCVVYVAAEMAGPGHVKHRARGDLILGAPARDHQRRPGLQAIAAGFERAGIPCRLSANIEADLWVKLIMNCAYNALSAVGRSRYGRIRQDPATQEVMKRITDECIAVARAAGIALPEIDLHGAVFKLGEVMADAISSTAQDLARGKPTEIDSLNGYVARRGAELGIPAPVNQTLHALVKLLEQPT